jgi:hypothetical protein
MSHTISNIKDHLIGMGHGSTLNKIRNIEALFERAASKLLLKAKPLETMRLTSLTQTVHDDLNSYALPSDYNALLDLSPQADRTNWDVAFRTSAGRFDSEKAIKNRTISIEGSEGSKIIRINWKSRAAKVLNKLDSLTANGTWSAVTGATNVALNTIFKVSGQGSIEFDLTATGGGIKNDTMTTVNLTDEDEVADIFVWVYLPSVSLTSIACRFGNDLTANYWTPTPQTTQADGTALKIGWNLIKFSWTGATETGTVSPSTIDAFQLTINGSTPINNIRVDNILFSIGRAFDIKYYTKYLFKNSSGSYLSRPTSDDDTILIDNDSLPLFLYECLKEMAHQMEGSDSDFDIKYAVAELEALYPAFRSEHPDQRKKLAMTYGSKPRFRT